MKKVILFVILFVVLLGNKCFSQFRQRLYVNEANRARFEIGAKVMPFGTTFGAKKDAGYGIPEIYGGYTVEENSIVIPYISFSMIRNLVERVDIAFKLYLGYQNIDRIYDNNIERYHQTQSVLLPGVQLDFEIKVTNDFIICLGGGFGPNIGITDAKNYQGYKIDFGDNLSFNFYPEIRGIYCINDFTISVAGGINIVPSVPYFGINSDYLQLRTPYVSLGVGYMIEAD